MQLRTIFFDKLRCIDIDLTTLIVTKQHCVINNVLLFFLIVVQFLAEKTYCGFPPTGGSFWLKKSPSVQKCAEECNKKVGFINLIEYGRRDGAKPRNICNDVGCNCRCVTGSCTKTAESGYNLYKVAEGKLAGFIYFLSTLFT